MKEFPVPREDNNVRRKKVAPIIKPWREQLDLFRKKKESEANVLRGIMEDYLNYRDSHDCMYCNSGPSGCYRCDRGILVRIKHEDFLRGGNTEEDWMKIWNSTKDTDTKKASA